ncbi:MAG: hypothetical protein JXA78_17990, partial [Anaerolineales bacterium]|nr:hypothetical protein [Anaerolineales bacterium]
MAFGGKAARGKTARFLLAVALLLVVWLSALVSLPVRAMPAPDRQDDPYPLPPTPGQPPGQQTGSYKVYLPLVAGRPFEDFSYYVASGSNLHHLGERRANSYACSLGPIESMAIFSFGNAYGDNAVFSYDQLILSLEGVKARVQNFIIGFHNEIGNCPAFLTIAVGINASITPSQTHGQNWGNLIDSLNTWVIDNDYADHVYIVGAIDIETQWIESPYYVEPQDVIDWVNSYSNATIHRAYNFGNAAWCPMDYPPTYPEFQNVTAQICYSAGWTPNKWTQEEIYLVSKGRMMPIPEIYHNLGYNADQWYRIGLYSKLRHGYTMEFQGSLTQSFACKQKGCPSDIDNTPNLGYSQLYNGLYDPYNRIFRPMYF